jgi:hypothetical protein
MVVVVAWAIIAQKAQVTGDCNEMTCPVAFAHLVFLENNNKLFRSSCMITYTALWNDVTQA